MELRDVREALLLAARHQWLHLAAVVVDNRIAGILPRLMLDALLGAGLVLVKAVVVHIAVPVEPAQRFQRRIEKAPDQIAVTGPMPQLRYDKGIERRRRDRAVVTASWIEVQQVERSGVRLVQHPSGLLVSPGVVSLALPRSELCQRAPKRAGPDHGSLPGRRQGVPAKQRHVERH